MKALVWTVATYGCESWTLRKNEETRLEGTARHRQSILWSHHEETREKEIMQGTMAGARRRGRPRTAWMDNIKTWTGLSVEESIRIHTYIFYFSNPENTHKISTFKNNNRTLVLWLNEGIMPLKRSQVKYTK